MIWTSCCLSSAILYIYLFSLYENLRSLHRFFNCRVNSDAKRKCVQNTKIKFMNIVHFVLIQPMYCIMWCCCCCFFFFFLRLIFFLNTKYAYSKYMCICINVYVKCNMPILHDWLYLTWILATTLISKYTIQLKPKLFLVNTMQNVCQSIVTVITSHPNTFFFFASIF